MANGVQDNQSVYSKIPITFTCTQSDQIWLTRYVLVSRPHEPLSNIQLLLYNWMSKRHGHLSCPQSLLTFVTRDKGRCHFCDLSNVLSTKEDTCILVMSQLSFLTSSSSDRLYWSPPLLNSLRLPSAKASGPAMAIVASIKACKWNATKSKSTLKIQASNSLIKMWSQFRSC